MVSTTMHLMPGCPIMRSRDLADWEIAGYVFDRIEDTPRYDAERNGMKVVATLVGGTDSKSRFNQVRAMFDYSFANYVNKVYFRKGEVIGNVNVKKSPIKSIEVACGEDITKFSKVGSSSEDLNVVLPQEIKAPIKKGDVVGKAVYQLDGVEHSVDIIAMQDAKKSTFLDFIKDVTGEW